MVFAYLFESFKTSALVFLLNDYFRKNYPDKYNEVLLNIGFNVIYLYSCIEMTCKNYIKKTCLGDYISLSIKNKKSYLEFIKDGKIVAKISKESYIEGVITDYDFVLYWDQETSPPNVKISYKSEQNFNGYDYKVSKIKFLLVELIVKNKHHIIELCNEKYNFYIKDNTLDRKFFLYYLNYLNQSSIELSQDSHLGLNIIDHNANVTHITFTNDDHFIKLDTNDYEIISKKEN